ncbi:uncharacterized protein A1O9_00264 [Exophiala aquamarina CBS 119918]|uniref:Calcineurin-like phosphoesterase domain-containing protein n=1 Tax=Exophiala aquamarina CBS 119918 TaxID=1182545 RepID=A0A072PRE4_9EURO|nr:uncharacterized protein A1O9_00264 [Exophiala aquamarina CBS 119918]KEF62292.1 hypothetical protein A1O9_00264 [Exophiala aquamarina CBS 119918]
MSIIPFAGRLLRFFVPLALCLSTYLYLYVAFHTCTFPSKDVSSLRALSQTFSQHWPFAQTSKTAVESSRAPFRLLVLADPQLEGDSSLPPPENAFLAKLSRQWGQLRARDGTSIYPLISEVSRQVLLQDIPDALQEARKRLDLFGNDYYLGHIYRTLHWWSQPTHVTVLGDLIGSQWVTDEEFEWRGWRYWNRVFKNGYRVQDEITSMAEQDGENVFDMTDAAWTTRIINIAGNHDIGYAGEVSERRMERFERVFGKADWDVRFQYPQPKDDSGDASQFWPSLHLIVLNSLVLDGPALSTDIQSKGYDYINSLISKRLRPVEDRLSFTLLLTHLPLYKSEGVCVDAPHFDYWGDDDGGGVYKPRGVKEQNHLSEHVSRQGTLEALFGMTGNMDAPARGRGRNGLILNGHDHEGCDTWHFIPEESTYTSMTDRNEQPTTTWKATRYTHANLSQSHTGVREITLRSMMGDYGGNAGLLSAWFDFEIGEWKYDIQMCGLNVKLWWAVHVIDIVCLVLLLFVLVCHYLRSAETMVKPTSQPQNTSRLAVKGN